MTIQVAAFRWVPPFAQGFVRDLRVRWALEEAGLPYEAALIDRPVLAEGRYQQWQPFTQVPAYRDEEVEMFESAAIILHIAGKSEALAPKDPAGAARVSTWVIAAINSIEPFMNTVVHFGDPPASETWALERKAQYAAQLDRRLVALAGWLGEKDWLEGRFTAGDLMMVTVLRELVASGVLARYPSLDAYRARGEARPAFARAMEAQLATFRENEPA